MPEMAGAEDYAKPFLSQLFAALVAAASTVVRQLGRIAAWVSAVEEAVENCSGLQLGIDRPPLSNQQIAAQSTAPGHPVVGEHQFAGAEA